MRARALAPGFRLRRQHVAHPLRMRVAAYQISISLGDRRANARKPTMIVSFYWLLIEKRPRAFPYPVLSRSRRKFQSDAGTLDDGSGLCGFRMETRKREAGRFVYSRLSPQDMLPFANFRTSHPHVALYYYPLLRTCRKVRKVIEERNASIEHPARRSERKDHYASPRCTAS